MIPFEVITMLGSSLFTGLLSIWSQKSKDSADQQKYLMQRAEIERASVNDARKDNSQYQSTTRRWMALLAVFFIVCLPKLAVFLDPSVQVHLMYLDQVKEGWWIFGSTQEVTAFKGIGGIVITTADTHFLAAISGFYFGSAATRR
jgi:hypothetical protein|tara:strand:- start:223 stop:657 length:435 start_codon:yes stop_codon:yes gene_type:complete